MLYRDLEIKTLHLNSSSLSTFIIFAGSVFPETARKEWDSIWFSVPAWRKKNPKSEKEWWLSKRRGKQVTSYNLGAKRRPDI